MKAEKKDRIIYQCFCAVLLLMFCGYLLIPRRDFSPKEKRFLEMPPTLNSETLLDGSFSGKAESWAADHLPGRDFLVGVNAWADRLANLQITKEIWVGRSGRLYERPVEWDETVIRTKMDMIRSFAKILDRPVEFMLIPSAGYVLREDLGRPGKTYEDDRIIREAYRQGGNQVKTIDLLRDFDGAEDAEALYYRTDHHWTSAGAARAYRVYLEQNGREIPEREEYEVQTVEGFHGSTWSRACLWTIPSEELELWNSHAHVRVSFSDQNGEYESCFFEKRLEEEDKYTVFLNGNHPLVRIENSDLADGRKLLVIRDSFSNCLGCFLANAYETVVLADLRYYRSPISKLCEEEYFDDILIVYSVPNFMTDGNIGWLG